MNENNIVQKLNKNYEKALKFLHNNNELNDTKKIKLMKIIIDKYNNKLRQINQSPMQVVSNNINNNNVNNIIINKNNKSALLIGINYYNTRYRLNGCINDTKSVKNILLKQGYTNITLLTDDGNKKPTKTNILIEITNLLKYAKPGDTLFLLYSGHGSYCLDRNNDELNRNDQMIVSCDLKGLIDDDLKGIIDNYLKPGVSLFCLFDSCYSGSVLDLRYQNLDSLNNNNLTINNKETETKGNVIMISGCTDFQTSEDDYINGAFNGALTWAFTNSYKPTISWQTMMNNMRILLKNNGYPQLPQLSSGKLIDIKSIVNL